MRQRISTPLALLFMALAVICAGLALIPLQSPAFTQTPAVQARAHAVAADPAGNGTRGFDRANSRAASQAAHANLTYGGGPVMTGTTNVYVIFWEPTFNVAVRYNDLILRFFNDVGDSSLYHVANQYHQANGAHSEKAVLAGSWIDTRPYPSLPLLDNAIQSEVTHAQHVQSWHSSMHNVFFVFTEAGANVCMDSSHSQCVTNAFCAYHSNFGHTIYATMPYDASFACDPNASPNHNDADQDISGASHELLESVTDPLGDGWIDTAGNEVADKCATQFGPRNQQEADVVWNGHAYLVQKEWDNQTHSCRMSPSH